MSRRPDKNKPRPIISGIILIGIGVFLLLTSHGYLEPGKAWPLLVIVVGIAVVVAAFTRGRSGSNEPPWQGQPPMQPPHPRRNEPPWQGSPPPGNQPPPPPGPPPTGR